MSRIEEMTLDEEHDAEVVGNDPEGISESLSSPCAGEGGGEGVGEEGGGEGGVI
jgi:hypothetical protein